ncbi:MAG: DUF6580 family putative transport protein [Terrimicrobiaceae bacterium]
MTNKIIPFIVLIGFAAIYRILPHPANFAPFGAMAFMAGVVGGWRIGLAVTLGALIVSDVFINATLIDSLFYPSRLIDYSGFLAIAMGAGMLRGASMPARIAGAFSTPFVFFFISNFGVWLFGVGLGGMPYAKSVSGLIECYFMALPFLRNSVLGDWFFMGVILMVFQLAIVTRRAAQPSLQHN